jgi:hypothetical protein
MRSYAVTETLAAEGQSAFLGLCDALQLQAPADASAHDVIVAVQDAAVDDMLIDEQEQEQQLVLGQTEAAVTGSLWANELLRPCQSPVWLGIQQLSSCSAAAAAARDVSLPIWLLAQALAAAAQGAAAAGGVAAARQLLQQLPAAQQVLLPEQLLCTSAPSSTSSTSLLQALPQLVVTATVSCLLQPPSVAGANEATQQKLQLQLRTVAEAAAVLQQHQGPHSTLSALQLVSLVQQLPAVLSAQPWQPILQQLLPQLTQQQLLASAMQLPQQQLGLLQPIIQQAACHAAVEAAVAASAAQAVSTGAASPYQQSSWRAKHPQERARSEASHPAVDFLQPCMGLVAEAEAAAVLALAAKLQEGQDNSSGAQHWQQHLHALECLQIARSEVWATCHGILQQQYSSGTSVSTVVTELQSERLAWAWAQLAKRMQQLLSTSTGVLSSESCRQWEYLQQQMAAALQLDSSSDKPLLWRLGGHPQLPPTMRLLEAQRKVAALAAALAAAGGAGFQADARGRPAALVAAGLDWSALLHQAVAAAKVQQELQQLEVQQPQGPNGFAMFGQGEQEQQQQQQPGAGSGIDFDLLLEGLEGGSAAGAEAELRVQLAEAAAAVLSSSTPFRQSVAQGMALLGFFPQMQLLQQHKQGASPNAGSGQHKSAGELAMQAHALLQVADTLQEQASSLLLPVLTEMLLCPQRLQHEAAGAAAVTAALKQQSAAAGRNSLMGQLLPARAMLSPAVRQMQVDLQPLVQLSALQEQQQINTTSLLWLLQAALASTGASASAQAQSAQNLLQQLVGLESRVLQAMPSICQSSCQSSAAAGVPYLQLSWMLSSMLDSQQWPLSAPLLQQVLPGLLHEACFNWQGGLWTSSATSATQDRVQGLSGSGFSRSLAVSLQVLGSPVILHVASQTVAALQVCSSVAVDGTSKAPRLQQLSLAVQHLLQHAGQHSTSSASTAAAAHQHWVSLAILLAQVLLSHSSSFQNPADISQLHQLAQQLLAWSSNSFKGSGCMPSAADAQLWVQQCAGLLSRSSHTTLAAAAQQLLAPCAEAVLEHFVLGATQQQQQGAWYTQLAQQGWATLLLGCARLQLVAPPAGVDPAGKYGYKAAAVVRWVEQQLDPAVCVQHLQQQLPGGLDAAPALQQLLQDRQGFSARLQQLHSRCVPRPDPPQYHHLHQEVSAFTQGLASPARLLAVGKTLLAAAQGSTPAAVAAAPAAAAQEVSSWDGSAAAWSERMQRHFGLYLDVLQPVLLAVLEVRHGLCLLAAGSQAAQQAAEVDKAAVHSTAVSAVATSTSSSSSEQLVGITAGLLSFPPPLAPSALQVMQGPSSSSSSTWALFSSSSTGLSAVAGSMLAAPQLQQLTGTLVHQQLQSQLGSTRTSAGTAAASDLAAFSWQLQCAHAALLVSVQELLAAGPAASAAAKEQSRAGHADGGCLGRVYAVMQQLVSAWQSVKEFEAQAAAEAAQLYKHKTQTKTFLTEEVRSDGLGGLLCV